MNKLQSLTLIALLGLMCSLRLTGSDYTSKMMTAQSQEQIQSKGKTIGKIEQVQSQEQVQSKSYSKPEKITQSQEQVQSKVSKGAKGGKVIQSQDQVQIQSQEQVQLQTQEQVQSKGKIEQVQSQEQVQSKSYSKPEKIAQSQEQVQSKVSKGIKGGKVIQSQDQVQIQSNSVKGGKTNGKFTNDDDIYDDVTFEDDDATLITDTKNSNKKSFLK